MNKSKFYFQLILILIFTVSIIESASARYRFEEGDWIAWGDCRDIHDIEIGKRTVYFASNRGVLRWDRDQQEWLYPWLTVPGLFDETVTLNLCREILEDPLTEDLYVKTVYGQYMLNSANKRWEKREPGPEVYERKKQQDFTEKARPATALINREFYSVNQDKELEYRFLEWPLSQGIKSDRGYSFYAWSGFGVGIAGDYNNILEVYPGGPGAATSFDLNQEIICCSGNLDREKGWFWQRERSSDKWKYVHPDLEWGLEPAEVNRLRIAKNGTVWLATSEGVMFRRGTGWKQVKKTDGLPRQRISDIAPFGESAWVATEFGLAWIAEASGIVRKPQENPDPGPAKSTFTRICSDNESVLWAAGPGIIYRFEEKSGWKKQKMPPTIGTATRPTALFAGDKIVAIGDKQGFAWKKDKGPWQEVFSFMWKDATVNAINYHGGYFWLGTNAGLVKYDPLEKDAIVYDRKDGLAGKTISEIVPEGDWLWLGTEMALVRFHWNVEGRID